MSKFHLLDIIYFCGEHEAKFTDGIAVLSMPVCLALSLPLLYLESFWIFIPSTIIWAVVFKITKYFYNTRERRTMVLEHYSGSVYDNKTLAPLVVIAYWTIIPLLALLAYIFFHPQL